ncbi:hypothetical protein AVEN_165414-1 [Araneus ventricosus]|uniref:Uncharacterized protein n=1 Tax=Araneus ventricosus TaxID=182803 RepID=A0A4Y2AT81_ARAVE|nr:hypothetical protein AVEN_165414-1 [Araneus ventricosus]
MTRTAPEPTPFPKLLLHTRGKTFVTERFNVHQTRLNGGSLVGSCFKPGTLEPRRRNLILRQPGSTGAAAMKFVLICNQRVNRCTQLSYSFISLVVVDLKSPGEKR